MNYQAQQEALIEKIAALEAAEPECECTQLDADVFDNRHCGVCNLQSAWNRERRALEAQLEDARAMVAYQNSGEAAWPEPWEEVA